MNTCICTSIPDYRNDSYNLISVFFSMLLFLLFSYNVQAQIAPNAEYATFTGGLTGMGNFECEGMPDFTYAITGDYEDPAVNQDADTAVPGEQQLIDNNGGGMELIYGAADNAQNIEVEVQGFGAGNGDGVGQPISLQVQTTLVFDSPTPAGEFAFIIADVEQDQVIVCAKDANGDAVPVSTIAGWHKMSFDANNLADGTMPPSWDTNTGTLVGQHAQGGGQQTVYLDALPDNEAGAAWFLVDIPITELVFKSEALGVAPDDPSQHFIFASTCNVYDLALSKVETSSGPYTPGDDVTYDIMVCNQGNVDASGIEISDYIPAGMTLSTNDVNNWTAGPAGIVTNTIPSIAVDACETVEITLAIDDDFMGTTLSNNAEITADDGNDVDSTPGDNSQPDDYPDNNDLTETDGGDDEDPEEITVSQVFDLALNKIESSGGPYSPGDDVTYTITVSNQGTLDATSFEVTDYIPADMTLSANDANGWVPGAGGVVFTGGALAAGASTTVDIVLTIDPAFQGEELVNFAEISDDDNVLGQPDVDSTPDSMVGNDAGGNPDTPSDDVVGGDGSGNPGDTDPATDEDDHDPELIPVIQTFDLALIKQVDGAGPFEPGDDVTFTITVCNQGTVDGVDIEISDYLPTGLTLSAADANGWVPGPSGSVVNTIASVPVTGACPTVDIVLTISPSFAGSSLINNAEITADNGDDVDSNPGDDAHPDDIPDNDSFTETDGGDDQDPEEILVEQPVYDLALIKELAAPGPYAPGDEVLYTITIFNQGTIDAGFIQIGDVIPTGMSLSTNDNNGWAGGPIGTVTQIIAGPVAGSSVTVDILLTVDANANGTLINNAEILTDNGDDVDSMPGDSSEQDDLSSDNDPNETDGGDDEDPEAIEVCNCDDTADAGTMVYPPETEGCLDDMGSMVTLIATPTGDAVIPAGYAVYYVLTAGADYDVVACSPTPTVMVSTPGWFTVHPVVYDPATFDPCSFVGTGTIFEMEELFAADPCICGDVDIDGVELGAYFCCLDMLQIDMDPIPPLLHDAAIGLMSKGRVDMPTSTTRFSGGTFVELQPGFRTELGSRFEAFIAPCAETGN